MEEISKRRINDTYQVDPDEIWAGESIWISHDGLISETRTTKIFKVGTRLIVLPPQYPHLDHDNVKIVKVPVWMVQVNHLQRRIQHDLVGDEVVGSA